MEGQLEGQTEYQWRWEGLALLLRKCHVVCLCVCKGGGGLFRSGKGWARPWEGARMTGMMVLGMKDFICLLDEKGAKFMPFKTNGTLT